MPDLDVTVHYADPDNLGDGLIDIHSPHLPGPVSAEFTTPAGMTEWLDNGYARLVSLGLQLRGAKSLTETEQPQVPESQRRFIARGVMVLQYRVGHCGFARFLSPYGLFAEGGQRRCFAAVFRQHGFAVY